MDMFKEYSPVKELYRLLPVMEPEGQELSEEERVKAIARPLLSWFASNARTLPWRTNQNPYPVWISEIMLQQTRVEAVKPYFKRFMEQFPDVEALAKAEEEVLLKLWEGLGYYSRARNLKKAAIIMMEEYGGAMPKTYEALLKLPGIGTYTAGAVASIAYKIPVPALDGNVMRVLSRLLESRQDIGKPQTKKKFETLLLSSMEQKEPGLFNQGLFEVGALVCIPNGAPKCSLCPLSSLCKTRKKGLWDEIPVKSTKKGRRIEEKTVFVISGQKEEKEWVALRKRPDQGLLAALYEFPNVEGHVQLESFGEGTQKNREISQIIGVAEEQIQQVEFLGEAKHVFSHVEWHMIGYGIRLGNSLPESFVLADIQELEGKYPLPNAFLAYRKALFKAK